MHNVLLKIVIRYCAGKDDKEFSRRVDDWLKESYFLSVAYTSFHVNELGIGCKQNQ